jgi:hypothetical protein
VFHPSDTHSSSRATHQIPYMNLRKIKMLAGSLKQVAGETDLAPPDLIPSKNALPVVDPIPASILGVFCCKKQPLLYSYAPRITLLFEHSAIYGNCILLLPMNISPPTTSPIPLPHPHITGGSARSTTSLSASVACYSHYVRHMPRQIARQVTTFLPQSCAITRLG